MAIFSFRLPKASVIDVEFATGRFSTSADAILATGTLEGASTAMLQFGFEPKVALAALTRSTHVVRDLPAALRQDSTFWVDAFKANPLLAMPETQPVFVRRIMVSRPTTQAEKAVAGQVGSLRSGLSRFSDLKPTDFHDLGTLQAAIRSREPFFTRWLAPPALRQAARSFFG